MSTLKITDAYFAPAREKLDKISDLRKQFSNVILNEYTNQFDILFIIFQCFPKDIKSRKVKEYKIQRRKTKTLELYLILDYERIMQGTDPENLNHIKEVFLKGCETFLKPLKDFKWNEFIQKINETI
jgi:hypothetical protein